MARIVCLGEAMLELARAGEAWNLGYGGDTLNTAIHLARAGHDVAYMTALGNDPFSAELQTAWRAEGIDTSLVGVHPSKQAGLYAISNTPDGERSFSYWRGESAARALFELDGARALMAKAETADLFYYSLISLAILPETGRHALLDLVTRVRQRGGKVAFDGNYRPRLWETREASLTWRARAIAQADIGLPTFEDEQALAGLRTPEEAARDWHRHGCALTVVKLGPEGCILPDGSISPPPRRIRPVDTSGAGDAFNGGFLAAYMHGATLGEAATRGHEVAGWTIERMGAIPPRDDKAPYENTTSASG